MEIVLVIIIVAVVWYLLRHIPLRARVTNFCEVFLTEYSGKGHISYWESVHNVMSKLDFPSYIAHSMTDAILSEAPHISAGMSELSAYIFDDGRYEFNYQVVVFVAYYRMHSMLGSDFTPKQQKIIFNTVRVAIDPNL